MKEFYLQLHITDRCGNRCRHCYQQSYTGDDISLKDVIDIMDEYEFTCNEMLEVKPTIAITGGDPLLHPDFGKILYEAKERFEIVTVLGNPETLLKIEDIGIFRGIKFFQLSLDGTEEAHDKMRYNGSFANTALAITMLQKNDINVAIKSTDAGWNSHEVQMIGCAISQLGAVEWEVENYIPDGEECEKTDGCNLGYCAMTILPDKTLMACRRKASSKLGIWNRKYGILYHYLENPLMKHYRNEVLNEEERNEKENKGITQAGFYRNQPMPDLPENTWRHP